jgi:hypothetical protein
MDKNYWEKEMPINSGSPIHITSYQKYQKNNKNKPEMVESQTYDNPVIGYA